MIRGLHGMFYSTDPEATRAFLRDQLGVKFSDVGDGWLIFDFAEAELGAHPLMGEGAKPSHELSFYCDDVDATVAELTERGVAFKGPVEDRGYGRGTEMLVPGGLVVTLYQPLYKKG